MIFILYFVFSAVFMLGMKTHDTDDLSFKEIVMITLLGWFFLPYSLGLMIGRIIEKLFDE